MDPVFESVSLSDFATLLVHFPFHRKVDAVHLHHTWRPTKNDYRGHDTILGMWRYHTQERGWDDIAQHLTIAPDGTLWLGRNWNSPPASARGYNGNRDTGPFMIEVIGDFDREKLEGEQHDAVIDVIAHLQRRFELAPKSLRFHRDMSGKTCPGEHVNYDDLVAAVGARTGAVEFPVGSSDVGRFGIQALRVHDHIASLMRLDATETPADGPDEDGTSPRSLEPASARGNGFTPAVKAALRPHVINLRSGKFSSGGAFDTSESDVDAIFGEHLPRALEEARSNGKPLRVLFYAHGGLVSEKNALRRAQNDAQWWRDNHVYPIFFVWETGLFETLGQMLQRAGARVGPPGTRGFFGATDYLLEELARLLRGPSIWSAMKYSAQQASSEADEGGAAYAVNRLKEFLAKASPGEGKPKAQSGVELHAVGHSAGAIFLGHFIPVASTVTGASFSTVTLLAPAIRVDHFKTQYAPMLRGRSKKAAGIDDLAVFTMSKDYELADDCINIYRKSLLYLIHYALEPEGRRVPILGLEESLRADEEVLEIFGLGGRGGQTTTPHEVVFSVTTGSDDRRSSLATNHAGFASDPPTMNSVVRRVLNSSGGPIVAYPQMASRSLHEGWSDQVDWPTWSSPVSPVPPLESVAPAAGPFTAYATATPTSRGRRALCIGIDEYARQPLAGCVRDAETWAATLEGLGFVRPTVLRNGVATRARILEAFTELVDEADEGDVIVFQFAGHGTQVVDLDGDEPDGLDEALCPADHESGALVTDDDLAEITFGLRPGINLTSFIDCCHSGTMHRVLATQPDRARGGAVRARYLPSTRALQERHREFRARLGPRRARSVGEPPGVLFSACQPHELAFETNAQGDFSLRATRLLAQGALGTSHEAFERALIGEFGPQRRQTPRLDCRDESRTAALLHPIGPSRGTRTRP